MASIVERSLYLKELVDTRGPLMVKPLKVQRSHNTIVHEIMDVVWNTISDDLSIVENDIALVFPLSLVKIEEYPNEEGLYRVTIDMAYRELYVIVDEVEFI